MCLRACVCERVKCRLITPSLRFHCSRISRTPGAETELLMAVSPLHTHTFIPFYPAGLEMLCGLAHVVVKLAIAHKKRRT